MRYVLLDGNNYYPSGLNDLAGVYAELHEAMAVPIKYDWQDILDVQTLEKWHRNRHHGWTKDD